jgi:spermidine/putrescine transport system permease protein
LTAAVSFDEFAVAWFVSGLKETVPAIILEILQGNVDPQINAIGSLVFVTSITLVVLAQVFMMSRKEQRCACWQVSNARPPAKSASPDGA